MTHDTPIRKRTKRILFIVIPLYILLALGSMIIAPISVMAFDAPGSENTLGPWLFVSAMMSFPLTFLSSCLTALLFYRKHNYKFCYYSLGFPFINIMLIFVAFFAAS